MIVINTHINQVSDFNRAETDRLNKEIKALGVDRYVSVNTVPKLLSTLETYDGQPILLFTNFSPNHFFAKNGIDVNDFQIQAMPDWQVEEYSFSANLYHHICKEYLIVEVHFITSALKRVLNDIDFGNVTNGLYTKVQRKRDWFKSGMDYNVLFKKYMLDRIYESVDSILIPSQKPLVRKPVAQFCQN